MLEENSYEPLAEVYLTLGTNYEDVYCLCSRVVISGKDEEYEVQESIEIEEIQNVTQQPYQIKRKDHVSNQGCLANVQINTEVMEEVLSCYCSASHCSTDEHDSVLETALHSDSGADLSESSRDLDWEKYWSKNGERIVWSSWINKYGEYIDPGYFNVQLNDDEETQFVGCETGHKSFIGFFDNNEEDEYKRVRTYSKSSEKSSLMTDSLTNITPMTIYSSELSCPEELSGQSNSNSFLSSADSVESNENQWQQLWIEHFNEQYKVSYEAFVSKLTINTPLEVYDNVFEDTTKSEEKSIEDIELDCSPIHKKNKINLKEVNSVGYLLGSLKTLSMERESSVENLTNTETMTEISINSEPPVEMTAKRGSKRVHEKDDLSLDRAKGAFSLMGFVFDPSERVQIEKPNISKARVIYKKKNIRSHNRSLNMKAIKPRHIRFDENGVVSDKINDYSNPENTDFQTIRCLELDEFSEKDDSSSCDSFSPDESIKSKDKQKKKKMSKKKTKIRNSMPKEILDNNKLMKYWYNRYRLFSLYDSGIKLDEESWYSVTPEKVSRHTAERCRCDLIIDACCGAGGNAIQFAFTCERVIAIDIDPDKIKLAKHNASIYGVEDRIEFIVGDFFKLAPFLKADVIFLSPPWGGPSYMSSESFCLDYITVTGGGDALFKTASNITPNIAYYLPKNINTDQLVKLLEPGGAVEIEQNFLEKKLIAITAYFGELVEEV